MERSLGALARDLKAGTYRPRAVRQVLIPRSNAGVRAARHFRVSESGGADDSDVGIVADLRNEPATPTVDGRTAARSRGETAVRSFSERPSTQSTTSTTSRSGIGASLEANRWP